MVNPHEGQHMYSLLKDHQTCFYYIYIPRLSCHQQESQICLNSSLQAWDKHPNTSRCVIVVSKVKSLHHSGLFQFMYDCISFPSPSTPDFCSVRKGNHHPQLPHSLLFPSLSPPYRPLISASNCQCQNPAKSATEIILRWLTCKTVKGNAPKRACCKAGNHSNLPSLYFSESKYLVTLLQEHRMMTPAPLIHILCLSHGGSSKNVSPHVRTV